jgi:hypothetical protein
LTALGLELDPLVIQPVASCYTNCTIRPHYVYL